MGTGAKVAIGCGIAVLVAVVAVVVTVGAGVYWAKGKVDSIAAEQKEIQDVQAQANKNEFVEPADGTITEPQLLKFIEVRKKVFDVYVRNEAALKAIGEKKEGDFGDVRKGFAIMNEVRLAQAKAQVAQGMSDAEYAFLVQQVYKSGWASEVEKSTGKSVSETAGQALDTMSEQMKKAADATAGKDDEARKALEKGMKDLAEQADDVRDAAASMDVPAANVALFRKHEAEIKKYAMNGLEWIGL